MEQTGIYASKMMWQVMNENTELKQENMMLKSKLAQIKRLLDGELAV